MTPSAVAQQIIEKALGRKRFLIAIAGPPGAGKSTLAEALQSDFAAQGERSKIVPMDGFHLDNSILEQRETLGRKGASETFDASGFVHLVQRLAAREDDVAIPVFDRTRDLAVAGADVVTLKDRLLIVEGNYLLLRQAPWAKLLRSWDTTVFISPGMTELQDRLFQRWRDHGFDDAAARERAMGNDIPNATMVLENSVAADIRLN